MNREQGSYSGTAVHHGNQIVAWSTRDRRPEDIGATASSLPDNGHACRVGDGVYRDREGIFYTGEDARLALERMAWHRSEHPEEMEPSEEKIENALASINRAHRTKFCSTRSVRDHDLAHHPVRTLADINARNRGRCA